MVGWHLLAVCTCIKVRVSLCQPHQIYKLYTQKYIYITDHLLTIRAVSEMLTKVVGIAINMGNELESYNEVHYNKQAEVHLPSHAAFHWTAYTEDYKFNLDYYLCNVVTALVICTICAMSSCGFFNHIPMFLAHAESIHLTIVRESSKS